jgi:hypothetical protein
MTRTLSVTVLVLCLLLLVHGSSLIKSLNRKNPLISSTLTRSFRLYRQEHGNEHCQQALNAFKLNKAPPFTLAEAATRLREAGPVPGLVVEIVHNMLGRLPSIPSADKSKEEEPLKLSSQELSKMFRFATRHKLLGYAQQVWFAPIAASPNSYLIRASVLVDCDSNKDIVIKFYSTRFLGQVHLMREWIWNNWESMGGEWGDRLLTATERISPASTFTSLTAKAGNISSSVGFTFTQELKRQDMTLDMRPGLFSTIYRSDEFDYVVMIMDMDDYCKHVGLDKTEVDYLLQDCVPQVLDNPLNH